MIVIGVTGWTGVYVINEEVYAHASRSAEDFRKWREEKDQGRPAAVAACWADALEEWQGLAAFKGILQEELKKQETPRATGNTHLSDHLNGLLDDPNNKVEPAKAAPEEADRAKQAKEDWDADAVFVLEGAVNGELNITTYFRLGLGAGYRYVSDVDMEGLSNNDFSGPVGVITLKFGKF